MCVCFARAHTLIIIIIRRDVTETTKDKKETHAIPKIPNQTKPKQNVIEMTDVRELATSHGWYLAKVSISGIRQMFEKKRARASDTQHKDVYTHTHKVQQNNDAENFAGTKKPSSCRRGGEKRGGENNTGEDPESTFQGGSPTRNEKTCLCRNAPNRYPPKAKQARPQPDQPKHHPGDPP